MRFHFIVSLLFLSLLSAEQTTAQVDLDSLWTVWEDRSLPDSCRLDALSDIAWHGYIFSEPDSAFHYAQMLYNLAEDVDDQGRMAKALNTQGVSMALQGDYGRALEYTDEKLRIEEALGHPDGIIRCHLNIGNIHHHLGNFNQALEHMELGLRISEEEGNRQTTASALNNIGLIHERLENQEKALEYYRKSLSIKEEIKDEKGMASSLSNIASIFLELSVLDSAQTYADRALSHSRAIDHRIKQVTALGILARIAQVEGRADDAFAFIDEGLNISTVGGDREREGQLHLIRGELLSDLQDHSASITSCRKAYEISEDIGLLDISLGACECLYDGYRALGDRMKALEFLEVKNELEEELDATETAKELERMEYEERLKQDSLEQAAAMDDLESSLQSDISTERGKKRLLLWLGSALGLAAIILFLRYRRSDRRRKNIQEEKDRSDSLLSNTFPEEIAEELKLNGKVAPKHLDSVSVLFTDFSGFTAYSEQMEDAQLMKDLDECFSAFDRIAAEYGIRKIKTIGDAYMAVGGVYPACSDHADRCIRAALDILEFIQVGKEKKQAADQAYFEIRVGIHTGPAIAGVVGESTYQFDVWGDTVNTASRMESSGTPGRLNISASTYQAVQSKDPFSFESRGMVPVKGKAAVEMYFVHRSD